MESFCFQRYYVLCANAREIVFVSPWLVTPTVTVQQQLLILFPRECFSPGGVCVRIINNDYSKKSFYFEK